MGCAREARWTRASRTEGKILIAVNAPQLARARVPVNYICRFLCKHTVRNSNRGWGAVMFEVCMLCTSDEARHRFKFLTEASL